MRDTVRHLTILGEEALPQGIDLVDGFLT